MRSDRFAAAAVAISLLAACEIEKVGIPRTDPKVSLHSVLSATASTQVVLLERTRTGSIFVVGPPFDLEDPIVTDEGIAESGALVRLTTPSGQVLLALEDNAVRPNGKGGGIYRFDLAGTDLQRNATYRLTVQTIGGENLSAETSVPGGVTADVAEQRSFDRARDTLLLEWPATPGARSYYVRIETPYGPRTFFTDSTRVRLTGDLRNVDTDALQRVFIPGFPQAVTVSAVDANYYDWYRSHNDPISGTGVVNRVAGGFGVFGSLVRLRFQDLAVVAPQPEPVAGRFDFVGTSLETAGTPYLQLELYVESPAARGDQPDALSGRYVRRMGFGETGCPVCGLLGTAKDGRLELALLTEWSASDTADVFTGEIRGDTIVGTYRIRGGVVHFVRQR